MFDSDNKLSRKNTIAASKTTNELRLKFAFDISSYHPENITSSEFLFAVFFILQSMFTFSLLYELLLIKRKALFN